MQVIVGIMEKKSISNEMKHGLYQNKRHEPRPTGKIKQNIYVCSNKKYMYIV
jgi:hypothetical protein